MTDNVCFNCGKIIVKPDNGFTTGYGQDSNGNKICYDCCAIVDLADMRESGKITLYLTEIHDRPEKRYDHAYKVTNWPGSLIFPVIDYRWGSHNIAGSRIDVWFMDKTNPSGWQKWHGVSYGDNTQLVHCRRINSYVPRHYAVD